MTSLLRAVDNWPQPKDPIVPRAMPLRVGDEVMFARPLTDDERIERFVVVELRGDRVLVSMKESGMSIVPTFVYLQADLTTV